MRHYKECGKIKESDTDNKAIYALSCNVIRDFCEDAIASGRLPSDEEIEQAVGMFEITFAELAMRRNEIAERWPDPRP